MRDRELHQRLGFLRFGDYVLEKLGTSQRTAQEMMRVDAALDGLPLLAAAFESGAISAGHVRILSRVARPENESDLVSAAQRLSVRELRRLTAAGRDGGATDGEVAAPDDCDGAGARPHDIHTEAWIAAFWRRTVWLVRRVVGGALPPGACLEMVLAEIYDGVMASGGVSESSPDPAVGHTSAAAASASASAADTGLDDERVHASASAIESPPTPAPWTEALLNSGQVHASARPMGSCPRRDGASRPSCGHPQREDDATKSRARALDRELRALFTERQRQDLRLAEHLRLVALDRGYRGAGFASLEEYAAERFGLSHGTLYNLLALRRRLEALPALRGIFLEGRLTARQAALLGSVATAAGVEAWVNRAGAVTTKQLEEEVDFVRHLRESRPGVWDLLDGGPPPDGVVLAPGQPPRLQETAPAAGSQAEAALRGRLHRPEVDARVHASAAAFLRALGESESATPFPDRGCVLRLWLEPHVLEMWLGVLAHLRATVRADLKEWEALALVLREFWLVWDNEETARQRRENPILERHGWRCAVPGCRSIGSGRLHVHHIIFRSMGGGDDPSILVPVCSGHHLRLIHGGIVRASGWAPDGVVWEMGMERNLGPYQVFVGERRIAGPAS